MTILYQGETSNGLDLIRLRIKKDAFAETTLLKLIPLCVRPIPCRKIVVVTLLPMF